MAWTLHGDILCEDGEPLLRLKPSNPSGWGHLRAQAAARKIAAAPDLLEALNMAVDFIENCTDDDPQRSDKFFACREAWNAAIAKATLCA